MWAKPKPHEALMVLAKLNGNTYREEKGTQRAYSSSVVHRDNNLAILWHFFRGGGAGKIGHLFDKCIHLPGGPF